MSDEPHIGMTMQINLKTGEHTLTPDKPSELASPSGCGARRAQKILREITSSVKLKKSMVSKLGMTPQQASAECGDEIY